MSREGYCQKNNLHAALILRAFRHLPVCLFSAVGLSHCSLFVCVIVCTFECVPLPLTADATDCEYMKACAGACVC